MDDGRGARSSKHAAIRRLKKKITIKGKRRSDRAGGSERPKGKRQGRGYLCVCVCGDGDPVVNKSIVCHWGQEWGGGGRQGEGG